MENASKALIMAGTILISVMVLSTAVMLVRMFGNFGNETAEKLEEHKLNEFNNQFIKFVNTKVTAHDIITLANLADQNNRDLLEDPNKMTPTEIRNQTEASKGNLFVNIKVDYKSPEGNPIGGGTLTYSNDRLELLTQDIKDNFLNIFSIQNLFPEKQNVTAGGDTLLDKTKSREPLPVYFLCTKCQVSETTRRVYKMEFQCYYYKSTPSMPERKKNEIFTNMDK